LILILIEMLILDLIEKLILVLVLALCSIVPSIQQVTSQCQQDVEDIIPFFEKLITHVDDKDIYKILDDLQAMYDLITAV